MAIASKAIRLMPRDANDLCKRLMLYSWYVRNIEKFKGSSRGTSMELGLQVIRTKARARRFR